MNWSTMPRLLSLLLLLSTALAPLLVLADDNPYAPWPKPDSGYISDHAGLLDKAQEERLERILWQTESASDVEIIIVIISSMNDYPDTGSSSIEDFATGLFNAYGVGNMPRNDGVLLLVAKDDRQMRIELGKGYGPHRDVDASDIIQDVIAPAFRKDDYVGGITAATFALADEFADVRFGFPWLMVSMFILAGVLLVVAISLFLSGKRGWGWVVLGLALLVLMFAVYLLVRLRRHLPDSDSDTWSSGGMGGFGGGSSGGGGATGSW